MLKLEGISKDAQIRGIQGDELVRIVQGCGSVEAMLTNGSAGVSPAKDHTNSSPANRSAGVSPAIESTTVSPANVRADTQSAKGWYSRDYLPHLDTPGLLQMITCRLADALPAQAIERFKQQTSDASERHKKIEAWLDSGHGSCLLRDPANAAIIEQAFWHFDGDRYHLLAWCVMPNHFHVLIKTLPNHPLAAIIHSWKLLMQPGVLPHSGPRTDSPARQRGEGIVALRRAALTPQADSSGIPAGLASRRLWAALSALCGRPGYSWRTDALPQAPRDKLNVAILPVALVYCKTDQLPIGQHGNAVAA